MKILTKTFLYKQVILLFSIFIIFLSAINSLSALNTQTINYQGKLVNSAGVLVPDGLYNMRFKLYTISSGGSSVWAETRISADKIQVTKGLFSVMLGDIASMNTVNFNQALFLGVEIGGSGAITWDGEMTPRKVLGTVPAAFVANKLDSYTSSDLAKIGEDNNFTATNTFNKIDGAGLTSCDGTLSKIVYSSSTKQFACATDATGGASSTLNIGSSNISVNNTATDSTISLNNSISLGSIVATNATFTNLEATSLTASTINVIASGTTNILSVSTTTNNISLISNVNGKSSTVNTNFINSNSISTTTNTFTSTINGIASAVINFINSFTQSVSGNILTSTINGVVATSTLISSNALSTSGTVLTSTINGVATTTDLTNLIASSTSNILIVSTSTNLFTLTSTVNGKVATTAANFVNQNSLNSVVNTLTSIINGISTSTNLINSNDLSFATSTNLLTSTVNGVSTTTSLTNILQNITCTVGLTYFCNGGNTRGANLTLGTNDNFAQIFETNNIERMRIDGSGNVGIGTTTPSAKLDITAGNLDLDNTTNANQFGIISKEGHRFLHDFNYGDNGLVITSGGNTFVGRQSGNLTMGNTAVATFESSFNTGVGFQALLNNSRGYSNSAFGYQSLRNNTTGLGNVGYGSQSLYSNQTANNGVAIGNNSQFSMTSGGLNVSVGNNSLYENIVGIRNVSVGNESLRKSKGDNNTAVGTYALTDLTSGSGNTAVGSFAFYLTGTTTNSTAIGYQSLQNNLTGDQNTALGAYASISNTTGSYNTSLGISSLNNNLTGSFNTGVGFQSLYNNNNSYNIAMGYQAGFTNTSGTQLVALGPFSLFSNTSGISNTAVGYAAQQNNVSGSNNVTLGTQSMFNNVSGSSNTVIGYNTGLGITTGSNNTILGSSVSGLASNLSNNIIIADGAGNKRINVDATGKVGIGTALPLTKLEIGTGMSIVSTGTVAAAIFNSNASIQVPGINTTIAVSPSFVANNTNTGVYTAVPPGGYQSYTSAAIFDAPSTEGNKRITFMGTDNTMNASGVTTRPSLHIFQRGSVSTDFIVAQDGKVGIGTSTPLNALTVSGGAQITGLVSCVGVQSNANGVLSCTSDENYKDIQSNYDSGLESVLKINPINYSWKENTRLYDGGVVYSGFSAQNVQSAIASGITIGSEGQLQINTLALVGATVNAIKNQQKLLGIFSTSTLSGLELIADVTSTSSYNPLATSTIEQVFVNKINEGMKLLADFMSIKITAIRGYFDEIFTNRSHQKELCIGDIQNGGETCITKAQLDNLLSLSSGGNAGSNYVSSPGGNSIPTVNNIILTLLGNNPQTISSTTVDNYIDPGATAITDMGISLPVNSSATSTINASTTPGTFTITYTAATGTVSTSTARTVIVE